MVVEHRGLSEINGSLVILEGVKNPMNEELVELELEDGTKRTGRIVAIEACGKTDGNEAFAGNSRPCF